VPPSPEPTAAEVIAALIAQDRTIAVAESLTGGLLVAELVSVPGASAVVRGGIVAYATDLKASLLRVDAGLLAEHGPVHPEVARQMAASVRIACGRDGRPADLGIATTGVAGPEPQGGAAVGTVHVGISSARGDRSIELHLEGDREQIRRRTVSDALAAIMTELQFPRE
jgi:nicotinamide-nucleotide amidase